MELYPAIDLQDGRCVRLRQGDYAEQTVYDTDPVAMAQSFAGAGARWIHVVDLDAARTGHAVNRELVIAIANSVQGAARVQSGGGIRSAAAADALLDGGVARVVVGTVAVERPELVGEISRRWPGRVAVGFDHRDGQVRVQGWKLGAGVALHDVLPRAEAQGAAAVIVTDIAVDGMLSGPPLDALSAVLSLSAVPVIASGGVASLDDIRALARLRSPEGRVLSGVIVGKALYEGRFGVADALAACREQVVP